MRLYGRLFDKSPDGVVVGTRDGTTLRANAVACRLVGYSEAEFVGLGRSGVLVDDPVSRELLEVRRRDGFAHGLVRLRRADGSVFPADLTSWLLPVSGGEEFSYIVFRDVSEIQEAEQSARDRRTEMEALLRASLDGYWLIGGGGRLLEVNDAACAMLGYTREEMQAMRIADVEAIEEPAATLSHIERASRRGWDRFVSRHRRKDGRIIDIEASAYFVPVEGGRFVAFIRDVTERKRAEEELRGSEAALRESKARLEAAIRGSNDGLVDIDLTTGRTYRSPRYWEIAGWPEGSRAATPDSFLEVVHPDDLPLVKPRVEAILSSGAEALDVEYRLRRRDGTYVWVRARLRTVERDESGRPLRVAGVVSDVTELRTAQEALRESEARYRMLAENASDVVWTMGPDLSITYVSPAVEKLRGFTPEEAMRQGIDEIHPPASAALSLGYFRKLLADVEAGHPPGSFRGDLEYRCRDGTTMWADVSAVPVLGPDGQLAKLLGVSRDITARRRAEDALRERETLLRTIADSTPDSIFAKDFEGRWTFANRAALRVTGKTAAEVLGRTDEEIMGDPALARELTRNDREIVASGAARTYEEFVRGPDGVRRFLSTKSPLLDGAGRAAGIVGVAKDVTDLRKLEEQLAVTSRLAALGTLVAGVGHEINNPLAAAMANDAAAVADLAELQERLATVEGPLRESLAGLVSEIRESVEAALEGDKRVARIVKDLVALGRSGFQRERVELRDVVAVALRWLPAALGREVEVEVEAGEAPDVLGQTGQLAQVVLNLITNACKAGRAGRPPRIAVRIGPGRPGMARLEVADDGAGMEPEVLKRVFDPFFSTREVGQGMGLGLSICHAIVTEHGGTITAASEPGQGSTFTVELPAAAAK